MKKDEILNTIREALKMVAPDVNFDAAADLADSDLDSMAIVDFFLEMETKTGLSFKESDIEKHSLTQIDNLVAYIENARS